MHEHETAVCEGVAVVLADRAFGSRTDVGKDESGRGLGCDSLQVHAVPGRGRRCEEARRGAQLVVCIETNTEAVGIVLSSSRVLSSGQLELGGEGGGHITRRSRESKDCLSIECVGSRISLESKISSLPL